MADADDPSKTIQQPSPNRSADVARAAVSGVLGAVPVVGSALAEAANLLMPDPTAEDRRRWEGHITEGVNGLQKRVDAIMDGDQETLTGAAACAARFLAETCPDGLAHQIVSLSDIRAACSEFSEDAVSDGLGDLESFGLIRPVRAMGRPACYRMTETSYAVLDPPIMGWNPNDDAREIAALVVDQRDGVVTRSLDEKLGWPRRRFNPALRIVVEFIADGRVSQANQPDYVTPHFFPNDAERARLRRFAGLNNA